MFAELEEAVDRGDAGAVSALLQAGADPDAVEDLDDPTLLMRAAEQGQVEVVEVLVAGGANVNVEAEDPDLDRRYGQQIAEAVPGVSALLYAGMKGHVAIYDFLHERTEPGLRRRVEQILRAVKRLKAPRENNRGAKALCESALGGDLPEIRKRLAAGTHVDAHDRTGSTALSLSVALGNREIVAFLLEAGADVGLATNEGLSPIHCAKDPAIIEELLKYGADPNAVENYGRRPLHFACGRVHDERQVRALLSAGADVNVADDSRESPLHLAAEFATAQIVELLLNAGADLNARTDRGVTAFDLASGRRDREAAPIVKILRQAGADVSRQMETGSPPN
ncbi:MAG: ankyrin repeat domain-containing protein [Deltaproteobacteria bacterium]